VIYMSTSGVYGDCGDAVVTEETPAIPQTARGKRRLDAESVFREWGAEKKVPVVILRVTGIYGPGRLPVSQLTSGQPVLDERIASLTNRIHADDLTRVCLAAAERGDDGDIFNVSDGHPGTMTEYFNAAADFLGLPRPRQVSWEEARQVMSPLMLSYVSESRRMDNRKMREKLGIKLLYPTLAEGIPECREERI
jgi:nucleoside-diphosphate-sugar epimerase